MARCSRRRSPARQRRCRRRASRRRRSRTWTTPPRRPRSPAASRSTRPRWVSFTRPISSRNSEAQAFFNQGFQLTYAFARPEAVRSFREAETRDPECAICYWGEAWAWGSDLNWTMSAEEAPFAYAAIQKAIALAPAHATPIEQALIRAMSVRYVARFDPARRVDQDRAYADAMKQVVDALSERPRRRRAVRGGALPARAPRGPAQSRQPQRPAHCRRAGARAGERHPPSRGVPSVHPHHRSRRANRDARPRAPSSSGSRFQVPATSTTCRRIRGHSSAGGAMPCGRASTHGTRT